MESSQKVGKDSASLTKARDLCIVSDVLNRLNLDRRSVNSENMGMAYCDYVDNSHSRDKIVALDCEMVGVGRNGSIGAIGRVSIVGMDGNVIMDEYANPSERIYSYRTRYSGLSKRDLQYARPSEEVIRDARNILRDKIVVGHALQNDFAALKMCRPPSAMIRDTSCYEPYKLEVGSNTPSLKKLSERILNIHIQRGPHDSVEDATAAMELYKKVAANWEKFGCTGGLKKSQLYSTKNSSGKAVKNEKNSSTRSDEIIPCERQFAK